MYSRVASSLARSAARSNGFHSSASSAAKVCVVGGAGGIGQPLSMLLSLNEHVSHVAVFDMVGAPGVAADLSHIDTPAKLSGHGMTLAQMTAAEGDDAYVADKDAFQAAAFDEALKGCDVVVIPAGVPRKPGMTRQDLFEVNASLNMNFAKAVAKNCPKAMVAIISNPVNSTVPIFAEQMKKEGCYDPKRIFGVTTLDIVRAHTFVAEAAGVDVTSIKIPVVGGHAGASILPLLSQATPPVKDKLSQEQIEALTHRIQNGGTEVVAAKAGAGSATLSMAKAGAQFAVSLVKALKGEKGVVECAYVESDVVPECQWFATKVEIGANGIEKNLGLGDLDDFETQKLGEAVTELLPSIKEGVDFIANQ
jgi:malate dehydrogenase